MRTNHANAGAHVAAAASRACTPSAASWQLGSGTNTATYVVGLPMVPFIDHKARHRRPEEPSP